MQYQNIVNTLINQPHLAVIHSKANGTKFALRLNNNKQYVNITNGESTKSTYGKLTLQGFPLFKANTPQEIKEALDKLENDSKLANKAKAVETAACSICGKPLTDPISIANGIGPECLANSDLVDELANDEELEE